MADTDFEVCQTNFFNWIYKDASLNGKKSVWRMNSYGIADSIPFDCPTQSNLLCMDKEESFDVSGKYRSKYFYHLPNSMQILNLHYNLTNAGENNQNEIGPIKFRDMITQTIFRESSTQTFPYEPEILKDEANSYLKLEIFAIAKLIKDFKEPGIFEVELIERARKRRQLENLLLTTKSKKEVKKYRKIIEAFEWEEWIAREEEIEYYQNMRMDIIRQMLEEKNNSMRANSDAKIRDSLEKIEQNRYLELEKIQANYNRKLRKLEYKHKNVPRKYKKENIIDAHIKMDSELYGPQQRYGADPKRRHFHGYRTKFETRLENLEKKITKPVVVACPFAHINYMAQPKKPPKEATYKFCSDKKLKILHESLKYFRQKLEQKRETPKCLTEKIVVEHEEEVESTVFAIEQDIPAEEDYQKCVFLQKLLKGRAIQNILYTGKEEFKGLIAEIDSTHTLQDVKKMFPDIQKAREKKENTALSRQKHTEKVFNDDKNLKTITANFEGSAIGSLFEFLEKELDRLYEQKRIQAIVMLAEQERFKREAIEAGKRQCENRQRDQYTEAYTRMTKSTKDNITMYLENMLVEESQLKASADARKKIKEVARTLDTLIGNSTDQNAFMNQTNKSDEAVIQGIVSDFLFSSVQNQLVREKAILKKKKNLEAIHKSLYEEYNIAEDVFKEILSEIIQGIVKCQSAEEIQNEEMHNFIKEIIKDVCDDSVHPEEKTVTQLLNEILDKIFKSENLLIIMDNFIQKDEILQKILTELKSKVSNK